MSSSSTFIINPTRGEEEEEMLAIDQGRSHTPPPGSRPSSRLEILMMDLVRSQADMARSQEESKNKLESLARSQAEQSKSTKEQLEERFESFARAQSEQSQSTKEQIDEITRGCAEQLANMMGRLSSLEASRHGTPSTSPNPGRRGSPS